MDRKQNEEFKQQQNILGDLRDGLGCVCDCDCDCVCAFNRLKASGFGTGFFSLIVSVKVLQSRILV